MTRRAGIRERLLAYILPRRPETDAQAGALEEAVDVQEAWETENGLGDLPAGVAAVSNDGVSMSFQDGVGGASGYTRDTISPVAWSILRNAGLIAYSLPTARKP